MTQAKLASQASDLKRRIYASLPFRYRVAQLLFRLKIADDFIKRTIGRALYAEFIRAGVTGMLAVNGKPALDLQEKVIKLKMKGANILPSGYGGRFGGDIWAVAAKRMGTRDADAIADVLQNVMIEVYKRNKDGKDSKLQAVGLKSAESYIKWLVGKRALDWLKKPEHSRQQSLTDPETGGMRDLVDTKTIKGLWRMLSPGDIGKFKRELSKIDRDNPNRPWEYIEGALEGRSNSEIARDWGVDRSRITQLLNRWRPELARIFTKFIADEDLARAM